MSRSTFNLTKYIQRLSKRGEPVCEVSETGFGNDLLPHHYPSLAEVVAIAAPIIKPAKLCNLTIQPLHGFKHVEEHSDSLFGERTVLMVTYGDNSVTFRGVSLNGDAVEVSLIPGSVIPFDHTKPHSVDNPNNIPWAVLAVT